MECPVCGSKNVTTDDKGTAYVDTAYGPMVKWSKVENACEDCGERGDFEAVNNGRIEEAVRESNTEAVVSMLEHLVGKCGATGAFMDRVLHLPTMTLWNWKEHPDQVSPEGRALLRILRTFPWILAVADDKFSKKAARANLLNAATQQIIEALDK